MKIKRQNPITGVTNELEINVTKEQIADWESGTLIQKAMPNLTPEEREFIVSGILPEEWDDLFPEEEEEEDDDYPTY